MIYEITGTEADVLGFALLDQNGDHNISLQSATSTTVVLSNSDTGAVTTLTGSGFTFSGDVPTGGTITGISVSDGNTTIGSLSDINWDFVDFDAAAADLSNDDPAAMVALFNGSGPLTIDASGVTPGFDVSIDVIDFVYDLGPLLTDGITFISSDTLFDETYVSVLGTWFDDSLYGGSGPDNLDGSWGNDTLYGGKGSDDLEGDYGNDVLYGGGGNDILEGNSGNDVLYGGKGNDRLNSGSGKDTLYGGQGNDSLKGSHISYGGPGDDFFYFSSGICYGGSGNDNLNSFSYAASLNGGKGDDILNGRYGNDTLNGGSGKDTLYGGEDNDLMDGGYGRDILSGGSGKDKLNGSFGNDTLSGGAGKDVLNGGFGNDVMTGGLGADTFIFDENGAKTVTDFDSSEGDMLQIDNALFGGGNLSATQVISQFADDSSGKVIFDFGGGNTLTLTGVSSTDGLADDLTFI